MHEGSSWPPRAAPDSRPPESGTPADTVRNPRHSVVVPKGEARAQAEPALTFLVRALRASSAEEREQLACRGLVRPGGDEPDTRALLLRQLYLAHLERGDCDVALEIAEEIIDLGELADIARQDAARAALGLGEVDVAVGHLRIAARICPADRRAFHLSTAGALLRFAGRTKEAVDTLSKAVRWATKDRALVQAQLALAEKAAGCEPSKSWQELREALEADESQKVYAWWVLGEICALSGDHDASADYLERFLDRLADAPRPKTLTLAGEIAHARELLRKLPA